MPTEHVLLIDDDKQWHTVCSILCEDFNYDCAWAATLREARDHLNKRKVETIILDLGFPDGQQDLLPPDVKEIDLVLAGLESSSRPLNVLICTAMSDPQRLALVEKSLAAANHKVRVFRKGGEMSELYKCFADITGRSQRAIRSPPGSHLSVRFALFALVLAFVLAIATVFVAPIFLPLLDVQVYGRILIFVLISASFFFGLLVLFGTRIASRKQVLELLKRGAEFAGRLLSWFDSPTKRSDKKPDDKRRDRK